MKKINILRSILPFLAVIILLFSAKPASAAKEWSITIIFGHAEEINGVKYKCVGNGICEIIVVINGTEVIHTHAAKAKDGTGPETFPVEGDIRNGELVMAMKSRLPKEYINPDGKYIFPVNRKTEVRGKTARDLGYKSFTIPKGNYEFDGQTIKIRLEELKPIEKDNSGTK